MKRILSFISLALALYFISTPFNMPSEAKTKRLSESTQAETKTTDSSTSSTNEQLWVEPSQETTESSSEFQYQSPAYENQTNSQPFTIIGLIILSLSVVIGIMIWSINTVNNKKKTAMEAPSSSSPKSIFKVLDSIVLESGKTLYLVQAFGRNLIVGTSWSSVSLIGEIDELPAEFLNTTEKFEEAQSSQQTKTASLDFLTVEEKQENNIVEVATKRVFGEIPDQDLQINLPEKPIQIAPINDVSENTISQKISHQPVSSVKKEVKTSFRDERKKIYDQQEWKNFYSSIEPPSNGQIKRSYSDSVKSSVNPENQVKRPSWLREKEARRAAIEASFAEKEAGNQNYSKEIEEENSQIVSEVPEIESFNVDSFQNKQEEEQVNNQPVTSFASSLIGTKLRRKISIVED